MRFLQKNEWSKYRIADRLLKYRNFEEEIKKWPLSLAHTVRPLVPRGDLKTSAPIKE
jgi:hypothetical protein